MLGFFVLFLRRKEPKDLLEKGGLFTKCLCPSFFRKSQVWLFQGKDPSDRHRLPTGLILFERVTHEPPHLTDPRSKVFSQVFFKKLAGSRGRALGALHCVDSQLLDKRRIL